METDICGVSESKKKKKKEGGERKESVIERERLQVNSYGLKLQIRRSYNAE